MKQTSAIVIAALLSGCLSAPPQPKVYIKASLDPKIGNIHKLTVVMNYNTDIDSRKILAQVEKKLRQNGIAIVDLSDGLTADLICGCLVSTETGTISGYTTESTPSHAQGYFGDQPFYLSMSESTVVPYAHSVRFKKLGVFITPIKDILDIQNNPQQDDASKAALFDKLLVWKGIAFCSENDFETYQLEIIDRLMQFYGTNAHGDYPLTPIAPSAWTSKKQTN